MNIHEYQAKDLFRSYNIPVSSGSVAYSADEIEKAGVHLLDARVFMDEDMAGWIEDVDKNDGFAILKRLHEVITSGQT